MLGCVKLDQHPMPAKDVEERRKCDLLHSSTMPELALPGNAATGTCNHLHLAYTTLWPSYTTTLISLSHVGPAAHVVPRRTTSRP
jgi:hypothetical protein